MASVTPSREQSPSSADLALFRALWPTIQANRSLWEALGPTLEGNRTTPWDRLGEPLQRRLASEYFRRTAYRAGC